MLQTIHRIRVIKLHDSAPKFYNVSPDTLNTLSSKSGEFRVYVVRTICKAKARYTPISKILKYLEDVRL
jgi:hypothetical protein